MVHKVLVFLS